MKKTAIFPGSFDPFTIGHKSIVDKSMALFDKIIIAIGVNSEKKSCLYSVKDRIEQIMHLYENQPGISVMEYDCLTIDFCRQVNAKFIIRGIRNILDFEYERSLAQINKSLEPDIETIFFFSDQDVSAINSSILRDILKHNGDIGKFVP